jgi:glycosyltransferase involved in cell wall biosynthesis
MRILFVTPVLPSATVSASARPFNLIRELSARHEVSVVSFLRPSEQTLVSDLEPHCHQIDLVPIPDFRRLGKWRNRLNGWRRILFDSHPQHVRTFPVETMRQPLTRRVQELGPDVVHFEGLYLVELLTAIGDLPAVLGQQNAESEAVKKRLQVASNPIHRLRDTLTWRKLRAFEAHWVQQFPVCTAVSETDARLLQAMAPQTRFYVVPNGVDNRFFAAPNSAADRDGGHLIFVGTMNYGPNVDGVLFFCREIWPSILKALPGVRLTIVGAQPVPEVEALGSLPGVTVTGFVDDVRPFFWRATASVVPLRMGGGTRLKILESLAAGCAVVSTTIGAEGLELEDGSDLLLADDPKEFAACAVRLLTSRTYRDQLAACGQRTAQRFYDWRVIVGELERAYSAAVTKR